MVAEILEKYKKSGELAKEEVAELCQTTDDESMEKIFSMAREVRKQHFGKKVFLYGFVYFSTYCKNNCSFCYFRKDNSEPPRYRKTKEEIVQTAIELANSGVHLIDLTTGDDPYYTQHPERLAEIIKSVKQATGLAVMVSPGVLDQAGIDMVKEAGADWYALYQETHTKKLYQTLRLGQSYEERISAKKYAKKIGMLIEEGLLVGVGDTVSDRVHSFEVMKEIGASQIRTMTFVPQKGAPLAGEQETNCKRELLTIAMMRLLFPDCLIPASLDVEGLKGLKDRLQAGANVVTSIIPPREGYAGVANSSQDIDEGYRTVSGIQNTLQECGVEQASAEDYIVWVKSRKDHI